MELYLIGLVVVALVFMAGVAVAPKVKTGEAAVLAELHELYNKEVIEAEHVVAYVTKLATHGTQVAVVDAEAVKLDAAAVVTTAAADVAKKV